MTKKVLLLSLSIVLGSALHAQQTDKISFTEQQQIKLDSLKQNYLKIGLSELMAQQRAETIVRGESLISTRARLATPPAGSIWIDRDTSNWANYHPVYHNYTAEQYVKKVLLSDSRAEGAISNVTLTGNTAAANPTNTSLAYFENGAAIGIEKGLILATGHALEVEGPAGTLSPDGNAVTFVDPDLAALTTNTPTGGSILEFEFKPYSSKVTFDFIFASWEYPGYSNSSVNDVFGFFIWEKGNVATKKNIAYFPDGTTPININNSNWGQTWDNTATGVLSGGPLTGSYPALAVNPQWHVPNFNGNPSMEYRGRTVPLTATADSLDINKTYVLKLAISNVGDDALGSGIFLSNLNLGIPESDVDKPYYGAWNTALDAYGLNALYSECAQTYTLKFTPVAAQRDVVISYDGIAKGYIVDLDNNPLPDTLKLAANDSLIVLNFKTKTVPAEANGSKGAIIATVVGGGADTTSYYSFYNEISSKIKYQAPAPGYTGKLELNIVGGSNFLFRSLDRGNTWEFARDTITGAERPFTQYQINNFAETPYVWLREPNACTDYNYHFITDSVDNENGGATVHPIYMPKIANATTNYPAGRHFVTGGKDFVFVITPDASNAGMVPVITTGRVYPDDSIGVVVEKNADGTFTVTIRQVRSAIDLGVSFAVGNESISNDKVWTSGNQLFIQATNAGDAIVYTMSGVYLQSFNFGAGELKSVILPKGIYIISLSNGQTNKVTIK